MRDQAERLKVLGAGILSLILTLGVARFAYTPLLPLMQQQAELSVSAGGWLAAVNYMGYLSGALVASLISDLTLKDRLYRIGLAVAVLTTVGMAITEQVWLWALFRYFAGLSSAAGLLLGSGLILNWLIRHEHRSELGIHFSGLGLGIAICALAFELMDPHFDWREQWIAFTLLGLLLMIPAWRWLPRPDTRPITRSGTPMVDRPPGKIFMRLFMAAYFCAGVGYVVSATFIVAIVDRTPGMEGQGAWTFLVLGLTAAPACIFWDLVARRVGALNALLSAYLVQIAGILLSMFVSGLGGALFGAALFGGSFIGIVSLVLTMAGRYFPTRPAKMMGKMTVSYGIAQILAPAVTGILAVRSGGYDVGLYLAAGMMMLGAMLIYRLKLLDAAETDDPERQAA